MDLRYPTAKSHIMSGGLGGLSVGKYCLTTFSLPKYSRKRFCTERICASAPSCIKIVVSKNWLCCNSEMIKVSSICRYFSTETVQVIKPTVT
ncbi:hypothetical protein CDAR_242991 [Caerostris darwini]|uniref:Uncharacterized protein n=1 Tax=Caerostris darwini TaxID=1538125 RepID=A0AAV4SSP8_9ARAC|nr:hypothetical protein CDAR_242991 [Caerostris darwini]